MVTMRRVNYRDDPNILQDDPHGGFDVPLDTHLICAQYSSFENMGSFVPWKVRFHIVNQKEIMYHYTANISVVIITIFRSVSIPIVIWS